MKLKIIVTNKLLCLSLCLILLVLCFSGCSGVETMPDSVDNTELMNQIKQLTEDINAQNQKIIDTFIRDNNIILNSKDVQYDMENNLDKQFLVEGVAKLSDYYNYGFDHSLEKEFFVMKVVPIDEGYSDEWYLYCHRESAKELFNKLKEEHEVFIRAGAIIPKSRYKKGQNNMAMVQSLLY